VREPIGRDTPAAHPLEAIVANRCRCLQRFLRVTRFELHLPHLEPARLGSGVAPDAGETVGLQLERDRSAVGAGPGTGADTRVVPEQVLNVMANLVSDDIGLREVSWGSQPP
jgi:hypothetical protein